MLSSAQDPTLELSSTNISQNGYRRRKRKQTKNSPNVSPDSTSENSSFGNKSTSRTEKHSNTNIQLLPKLEYLNPHKSQPRMSNRKVVSKFYSQRPPLPSIQKLDYASNNLSPVLARKELLKNKLLTQKLATRFAEAKLSLAEPDSDENSAGTLAPIKAKCPPGSDKPSVRVSFRTVSKRVANIMKFRNAAQPGKYGATMERELSIERSENLPKTPRFSSYMSAAAQYALMKGYEDIIFEKLSSKYPECTDMLKRNKTPHHSIAISDKSELAHWKLKSLNSVMSGNAGVTEHEFMGNSVDGKDTETISKYNMEIASSENDVDKNYLDMQDLKTVHTISNRGHFCDDAKENLKRQFSSDSSDSKSSPSSRIFTIKTIPEFSPQPYEDYTVKKQPWKYGAHEASSSQNFPKIASKSFTEQLRRDRRIVLTYRMEKAMDILDAMKTKSEHALSPRVSVQYRRHNAPLLDFSRWTDQWAHEFDSDAVK